MKCNQKTIGQGTALRVPTIRRHQSWNVPGCAVEGAVLSAPVALVGVLVQSQQ